MVKLLWCKISLKISNLKMSHRNPTAMKIFQTVRESFVLIYFSEDRRWFDIQMLANIVECILVLALQCIYLFHVADTPDELMHSIFYFTVGILVFISFMSTVQQIMDIFILMNKVEKVINKSELANWMYKIFFLKKIAKKLF